MNLNDLAKRVTLREGLKVSLSIAQVKEVIRHTLIELSKEDNQVILKVINRYVGSP